MAETFLKDSRTASNTFRLNTQTWDGVPKPRFLYYVKFVRSNSSEGNDHSKSVGILAKNIDRPGIKFDSETLNQYNKKRIVYKKVDYDPVSFTFHDTVDNKVAHMFEDYFRFYFGDPRNKSATDWAWDQMAAEFNQGTAGAWGYVPPKETNLAYYFSHIELYYLYGGKYTQYDLINPKIEAYSPSEMDYSDSEGAEITMRFSYEGYVYQGNNKALSSGLAEEMGISLSGFNESPSSASSAATASYQQVTPTSSYNPPATAQSSTAQDRSAALLGNNTTFNNILNTLLDTGSDATDNIAQRIMDSIV